MNARLQMKLLRQPQPRVPLSLIGSLVDSIDFTDPTRSHELAPSKRMASRHSSRRTLRRLACSLLLIALLCGVLALVFQRSPAVESPTIPVAAAG